jgi:UDP-glucose:(heptosyl)LPS alpha-1,3-glucosyltransferase
MEQQEVFSDTVQIILPVSHTLRKLLVQKYPSLSKKKLMVAWPGTEPIFMDRQIPSPNESTSEGIHCVFVGREWKRKGLIWAIKILETLASDRVVHLDVYGVSPTDLPHKIRNHRLVTIKGWTAVIPWTKYDLMLHLATIEPFGMVIGEARARGLPVLTTVTTGAAELNFQGVTAIEHNCPLNEAAKIAMQMINDSKLKTPEVIWTWDDLADLHINSVYPQIEF